MTSCPRTPHPRSRRSRSAVEVAEGLVRLAQLALEDLRAMLVPLDLLDLRAMLGNADLPDRKALEVFRVPLDLLAVELEELPFLDLRVMLVLQDLLDQLAPRVLLDQLAPRVLLDLPVRTQSPLSLIGILPNPRPLRLMARRRTSRMPSDRPTRSRTALGTTRQ